MLVNVTPAHEIFEQQATKASSSVSKFLHLSHFPKDACAYSMYEHKDC